MGQTSTHAPQNLHPTSSSGFSKAVPMPASKPRKMKEIAPANRSSQARTHRPHRMHKLGSRSKKGLRTTCLDEPMWGSSTFSRPTSSTVSWRAHLWSLGQYRHPMVWGTFLMGSLASSHLPARSQVKQFDGCSDRSISRMLFRRSKRAGVPVRTTIPSLTGMVQDEGKPRMPSISTRHSLQPP